MTMKRFATTLLMAMAASLALSDTVRMGALSTDTTVETLGEGAAAVQLVSKARFEQALASIAIGSDDSWMVLDGSTGLIYQVATSSNLVVVATSMSGGAYNGPAAGTPFLISSSDSHTYFATTDSAWFIDWNRENDFFYVTSTNPVFGMSATVDGFPLLVGGMNDDSHGFATFDWLPQTNVYQIAVTEDIPVVPDLSSLFAGTNWYARTSVSGTVSFANLHGRPQRWSGTGALTVSGFTGLTPPSQVYWTLAGFDSVTLPASAYVVGGGAWQTNMINHFTVWQVGTNVMLNFITATEAD